MKETVVLITGATSGIGEAAAEALVNVAAVVVLVGRSEAKSNATVQRLRTIPGAGRIESLVADLTLLSEVERVAGEFEQRFHRLDVLINNASAIYLRRQETTEGFEATFALNYLAYFHLANTLTPLLKRSAPSRIINVASSGHLLSPGIRFHDLQYRNTYKGLKAYHHSKLADVLFTYELARRLEGTGVTVNAVDPGMVKTNLGRNNGIAWRLVKPLVDRVCGFKYISAPEGARTLVYLSISSDVADVTGRYFANNRAVSSSPGSYDRDAGRRLWEISDRLASVRNRFG